MTIKKLLLLPLGLLMMLAPCACTEEESDLGVNLQDPFTIYSGVRDTAYMSACTVLDDSLSVSGYTGAVIGNWEDTAFGSVSAVLYTQVATSKDGVRIPDSIIFDSVVMTLVIDTMRPVLPDSTLMQLHLTVRQLAEPLRGDSNYYSNQGLPLGTLLFDNSVPYYTGTDSLRFNMGEAIYPILKKECSQAEFLEWSKGLAITLTDNVMLSVNLAATNTRLTAYYRMNEADTAHRHFDFVINSEAAHSMYYRHEFGNAAHSPIKPLYDRTQDSIDGKHRVYLEPLGGTRVRLNLQGWIDGFRKQHPTAVIHYAELVLPISDTTQTELPVRIMAMKKNGAGELVYVTDADVLTNQYTYAGFDGYYHKDRHCYRLRVTRHLQELMRSGQDYGTELVIDGRRSTPFSVALRGSEGERCAMIDFVYTE